MRLIDADEAVVFLERMAQKYASIGRLKEADDYMVTANILRNNGIFKTIEAEPVRHGKWIERRTHFAQGGVSAKCSICQKDVQYLGNPLKYCPNCGAKMDGGASDA